MLKPPVYPIIKRYNETGLITYKPKTGGPRIKRTKILI